MLISDFAQLKWLLFPDAGPLFSLESSVAFKLGISFFVVDLSLLWRKLTTMVLKHDRRRLTERSKVLRFNMHDRNMMVYSPGGCLSLIAAAIAIKLLPPNDYHFSVNLKQDRIDARAFQVLEKLELAWQIQREQSRVPYGRGGSTFKHRNQQFFSKVLPRHKPARYNAILGTKQ